MAKGEVVSGADGIRALAVDSTHVYWSRQGAIMRCSLQGGGARVVAEFAFPPAAFAADDEMLFWASPSGTIWRCAKHAGVPEVVASGERDPRCFITHEKTLWWVNADRVRDGSRGGIRRLQLGGSPETLIATRFVEDIAVDGECVYWGEDASRGELSFHIRSIRKDDRTISTIAQHPYLPRCLAVTGGHLMWIGIEQVTCHTGKRAMIVCKSERDSATIVLAEGNGRLGPVAALGGRFLVTTPSGLESFASDGRKRKTIASRSYPHALCAADGHIYAAFHGRIIRYPLADLDRCGPVL